MKRSKRDRTVTLRVRLRIPDGANKLQVMDYVRNAVMSHCGGLDPEDEMFDLERKTVKVSLIQVVEVTNYQPRPPDNIVPFPKGTRHGR